MSVLGLESNPIFSAGLSFSAPTSITPRLIPTTKNTNYINKSVRIKNELNSFLIKTFF